MTKYGCLFPWPAADFIILEKAWALYPPAPLPTQGMQFSVPEARIVSRNAETAINGYVNAEIEPLIGALQTRLRTAPSADLYNRLGILLVRAGRPGEAKAAYERAAGMGSAAAMTNRGNMALLEKDLAAAERWFRQALQREPGNAGAVRGLKQITEDSER
jgi:tetratricopeptide (TPR) repeat protein